MIKNLSMLRHSASHISRPHKTLWSSKKMASSLRMS